MKKFIFMIVFFVLIVVAPVSVMAQVSVQIRVPLPPPILFPLPPAVVVIPETEVYAVPDVEDDIFFYNGWWWRPWDGRWYRSRHYDRGWVHYNRVPSFHRKIHPGWRNDYRDRRWGDHEWEHRQIPYNDMQKNWRGWKKDKYWEKQHNWGLRKQSQQTSPRAIGHQPPVQRNAAPPPRPHNVRETSPRVKPETRINNNPQREVRPQPRQIQERDARDQGKYQRDTGRDKSQRQAGTVKRQDKQDGDHREKREKR